MNRGEHLAAQSSRVSAHEAACRTAGEAPSSISEAIAARAIEGRSNQNDQTTMIEFPRIRRSTVIVGRSSSRHIE